MAFVVTIVSAIIAFPIAYYMAMYTSKKSKAFFYVAVMVPLWSSYLVRVYSWKLILAKERYFKLAIRAFSSWLAIILVLQIPVIGGGTLSTSYIGTMIVFVYIWLPFMILPIQAALEKIPTSLLDASADLGAKNQQTFWLIIFPLTLPGIFTGSIFTFSLTLGDYIIPGIIGSSRFFIGQAV